MPAIHPILGHLPFLRGVMASLPKNASIQTVLTDIVSNYSNGVCYLDLWPFARKLIIVASPLIVTPVATLEPLPTKILPSARVVPSLPLNVFQSVELKAPVVVVSAVAMLTTGVVVPVATEIGAVPLTLVTVPD